MLVVGHRADLVEGAAEPVRGCSSPFSHRSWAPLTRLQQAEPLLAGRSGTVILLSGDVPLLKPATLERLLDAHRRAGAAATVVTAIVERPYGYGRIVRTDGRLARIVEERDATPAERQIKEINGGIYAFDLAPLFESLRGIASQNAQGEYYLTDLVGIYRRKKLPVETIVVEDPLEIRGINSRTELAEVSRLVRQNKNEELMAAGVTIIDPATTYIDPDVQIGADTVIHPGVIIEGRTRIGSMCEIQAHVRIADCEIGDRVRINNFCLLTGAQVAPDAAIGPFAHIRPETTVGEGAKIGNFRGTEEDIARRRLQGEPPGVLSGTPRSAPTSTSVPGPSSATTTGRRSSARSSRTARSSAAIRS